MEMHLHPMFGTRYCPVLSEPVLQLSKLIKVLQVSFIDTPLGLFLEVASLPEELDNSDLLNEDTHFDVVSTFASHSEIGLDPSSSQSLGIVVVEILTTHNVPGC